MNPEVFAAGGIVTRRGTRGVEVLVVHRPRYDDWSFPKGKRDPGETDEQTARREVLEETGLACDLVDDIGVAEYIDHRGRAKQVRYWTMVAPATEPSFVANDEVDAVHWLTPADVRKILTYDHDRDLLDRSGVDRATP